MIINRSLNQNNNDQRLFPLRLKKKVVSELLGVSVNQLRKISLADESFPKPLKSGPTRQAGVYFDYQEIIELDCHHSPRQISSILGLPLAPN